MTESRPQVILVTGAASGIGAALARRIVARGDRVIVADINLAGAQAVANELGPDATAAALDICAADQWEKVLDQVWQTYGRLDALVNNAAIVHTGYARDVPMAAHEQTMDTNFFGPVKGMLAALPRFKAQGFGHLVTVCSMTAFLPFPGIASYAAAKHALRAFHLGLALEERDTPVKFTIVHPTSTETPMLDKEAEDDVMALAFAGTPVTADYVAGVVLDAMRDGKIEEFAPPERGDVVRNLSIHPEELWPMMDRNAVVGAEKLAARRAAAKAEG